MSVITPADAEARLGQALDELEDASLAAQQAEADYAQAEATWKLARAASIMRSSLSSADRREAEAQHEHQVEFHAFLVAKGRVEGGRLRVGALRQAVMGLSSLNASARQLGGGW